MGRFGYWGVVGVCAALARVKARTSCELAVHILVGLSPLNQNWALLKAEAYPTRVGVCRLLACVHIARMKTSPSILFSSTAHVALMATGEGGVPEWIELLPKGALIKGRDGRTFKVSDVQSLVDATLAYNSGRDIVVDFEHATDKAAPEGRPAPASGWISALEVRDGAIWGRVAWTKTAHAMIAAREYRYTSPVFYHEKTEAGQAAEVFVIARVALTNDPNLTLTALNSGDGLSSQVPPPSLRDTSPALRGEGNNQGAPMNIAALCAALGLAATATEAEVLTAINSARSSAASTPDMALYVPKAQHDAVVVELNTVKTAQGIAAKAVFDASVNSTLDAAVAAGKVVPAAREQYKAMCSDQGGLDNFKALVDKLPVIASADAGAAAAKVGDKATGVLGAEEIAVCSAMGLTSEQYLAQKKKEAA
jgi:phage I-like protein